MATRTDLLIRSVTSLLRILNPRAVDGRQQILSNASTNLVQLLNELALLFVLKEKGDVTAVAVKITSQHVELLVASHVDPEDDLGA